jgi:hypothetical protein
MAKTNVERQKAMREKRLAEGLKRYEVWCHPKVWPLIKRLVERLAKRGSDNQ